MRETIHILAEIDIVAMQFVYVEGYHLETCNWQRCVPHAALLTFFFEDCLPEYHHYCISGGRCFFIVGLLERYPRNLLIRHI